MGCGFWGEKGEKCGHIQVERGEGEAFVWEKFQTLNLCSLGCAFSSAHGENAKQVSLVVAGHDFKIDSVDRLARATDALATGDILLQRASCSQIATEL